MLAMSRHYMTAQRSRATQVSKSQRVEMLKTKRTGFVPATTLNSAVVVHTLQEPQHVSKDEVLQLLDEFLVSKDRSEPAGVDVNLSASLSQLRRIQRDFKGLPPTALTENAGAGVAAGGSAGASASSAGTAGSGDAVTKSATGGTKTKFEDD